MKTTRKYFGTDGIRGKFGASLINPQFLLQLGWAIGKVLAPKGGKIIIGKDTRISGYVIESVLEAGLISAGANVRLVGPMPTPSIAYLTRVMRAQAGIVISASHNPFYDNGIKIFSKNGTKLSDELELAIENQLCQSINTVDPSKLGKVKRYNDAAGRYIEFCKSTFGNIGSSINGLKIVLDCANGATYHVAPRVFQELGADITEININPDGFNINEYCGSTNPDVLKKIVLAEKADLGIAFDGDGDRVIMVDHTGETVDGDDILFIIAKQTIKQQKHRNQSALKKGVVGTLMSNLGLEQALNKCKIPFTRTKIGDRYILEELHKNKWSLGGETSGHILNLDITSTGDGIVTALQVLSAMIENNKSLHDIKSDVIKYPQIIKNVKIENTIEIENNKLINDAVTIAKKKLGSIGRILIRPSGTEPLIRVMVEGEDEEVITSIADELASTIEELCAQK